MGFQAISRNLIVMFFVGLLSASQACKIQDINECVGMLTELGSFEEIADLCDGISGARSCFQGLLDSNECNEQIEGVIESNMGILESIDKVCEKVTGNDAVECSINGVLNCVRPAKAAEATDLLCTAINVAEPCLGHIEDACPNQRLVKLAVKSASALIDATSSLCP